MTLASPFRRAQHPTHRLRKGIGIVSLKKWSLLNGAWAVKSPLLAIINTGVTEALTLTLHERCHKLLGRAYESHLRYQFLSSPFQ